MIASQSGMQRKQTRLVRIVTIVATVSFPPARRVITVVVALTLGAYGAVLDTELRRAFRY